jgi:hypothetical protein
MTSLHSAVPEGIPQATDRWENEGGLLLALAPVPPRLAVRTGKRDEDTAAGCRSKAAADLVRAEALGLDRMRWRMEHSAAAWTARAEILEMIERKAGTRRAAARLTGK